MEGHKNLIDTALQGLGGIPQTKRHMGELKQPKGCDHGCLGDVRSFHRDLMLCPDEVNLAEIVAPCSEDMKFCR